MIGIACCNSRDSRSKPAHSFLAACLKVSKRLVEITIYCAASLGANSNTNVLFNFARMKRKLLFYLHKGLPRGILFLLITGLEVGKVKILLS